MSLRTTIRDHLLGIWAGEPWYGSSSKQILEDVTAAEAAARPLPGAQTIWETTLHMAAWTEEATSRVRGNRAKDPPDGGDWTQVTDTSPAAWTAATDRLRAARYALLEALEKAHEEDLYMLVGNHGEASTTKVTRAQTASGLVEHDVYHLGQIALLKKSLRAKG